MRRMLGRVGGGSPRTRKGDKWFWGGDGAQMMMTRAAGVVIWRGRGRPVEGALADGDGWIRMTMFGVRQARLRACRVTQTKEAQVRTKDTKALSAAMTVVCRVDGKKGDASGLQDERDDVDDVVVILLAAAQEETGSWGDGSDHGSRRVLSHSGEAGPANAMLGVALSERGLVPYRRRRDDGAALIRLGGGRTGVRSGQ